MSDANSSEGFQVRSRPAGGARPGSFAPRGPGRRAGRRVARSGSPCVGARWIGRRFRRAAYACAAAWLLGGCPPPASVVPAGPVPETGAPAAGAEAAAAPDAASLGAAATVENPAAAGPERGALEARLREGGVLYRLAPHLGGPACQPWVFRPHGADAARGLLVREVFTGRRPAEFAFTYAVGDAGLELVGPFELQSIPGTYADVGDDPPGARFSVPWQTLGGVAPGTSERWFLDEAECRATSGTTGAATGIPTCDAYLALYRDCEDRLRRAVADGELRTYEAEAAWLAYAATTPERDGMAQACTGLLQSLRERCSPER